MRLNFSSCSLDDCVKFLIIPEQCNKFLSIRVQRPAWVLLFPITTLFLVESFCTFSAILLAKYHQAWT